MRIREWLRDAFVGVGVFERLSFWIPLVLVPLGLIVRRVPYLAAYLPLPVGLATVCAAVIAFVACNITAYSRAANRADAAEAKLKGISVDVLKSTAHLSIQEELGNLYMRRFVLGWKRSGHEQRWQAYIVNYADDLVICCREGAEQALATMRRMMGKLKLTVNEAKTRICRLPEEKFDFLGYTFGRCYSPKTGRAYLGTVPAPKRIQRICGEIRATTARTRTSLDSGTIVAKLNRMLVGWANYFCLGPVSNAYRAVDSYAKMRLRLWLRTKHKVLGRATEVFPDKHLYGALGLVRLDLRTRNFPWAKA